MSANVIWQETTVDRARRWQALGQQGATVWFTGLPGAGKTTIASAVEARLIDAGRCAYRLDGDNIRHGMCSDLGFSKSDRETNVGRVGEMARLFADAGTVALVALVSPYNDCREKVRALHERGLTGVDDPYEPPSAPEVELTPKLDVEAATAAVLAALDERSRDSA